MEELQREIGRKGRRESGPLIVYENEGQPWKAPEFRRPWRKEILTIEATSIRSTDGLDTAPRVTGGEKVKAQKLGPQRIRPLRPVTEPEYVLMGTYLKIGSESS